MSKVRPEHDFPGLLGFFQGLERRKYKMHVRVFLSRWRSYHTCPACGGTRLRPESLAVRIGGQNLAEISRLKIEDARRFLSQLPLTPWQRQVGRLMLDQAISRLGYLEEVGLGYLSLDRTLRTLSGGEAQRVALTSSLGSNLVHMLYVLDEPSVGLHPCDVDRLDSRHRRPAQPRQFGHRRRARRVDHPGRRPGDRNRPRCRRTGRPSCLSGDSGRNDRVAPELDGRFPGRTTRHIWKSPPPLSQPRLDPAGRRRGNNLQNITVEFPLGLLCVVTGVSGAGKSTLVQDTLYPALRRRMHQENATACPYDDVYGDGQLNDVIMVDQSPIGRSPRSNPVTYIKAFDEIRAVFADTVEARTRNLNAAHFSFNIDGGRCPTCHGDGYLEIDMQFLADVYMKCGECQGRRYRREILNVKYRGRNIADVLEMTVREAFTFFRGYPKVQARLKRLIDVGLDYLRLGQPANTLSGGEAQRLKLAGYMSASQPGTIAVPARRTDDRPPLSGHRAIARLL